jgi:iron complex outermembrane receptor protein
MAQNIQISGVVKDVVGDPLIGVSVLVKGGTKGTSTDYNGFYTISAPADGTLVFSYVLLCRAPQKTPINFYQ